MRSRRRRRRGHDRSRCSAVAATPPANAGSRAGDPVRSSALRPGSAAAAGSAAALGRRRRPSGSAAGSARARTPRRRLSSTPRRCPPSSPASPILETIPSGAEVFDASGNRARRHPDRGRPARRRQPSTTLHPPAPARRRSAPRPSPPPATPPSSVESSSKARRAARSAAAARADAPGAPGEKIDGAEIMVPRHAAHGLMLRP